MNKVHSSISKLIEWKSACEESLENTMHSAVRADEVAQLRNGGNAILEGHNGLSHLNDLGLALITEQLAPVEQNSNTNSTPALIFKESGKRDKNSGYQSDTDLALLKRSPTTYFEGESRISLLATHHEQDLCACVVHLENPHYFAPREPRHTNPLYDGALLYRPPSLKNFSQIHVLVGLVRSVITSSGSL